MMSAGPFVAGLKCSGNVFWGISSFAWQRGTLQIIAILLITLHNILEYMQIAIIQTEAADFVKFYICVILKAFGHNCTTVPLLIHTFLVGHMQTYTIIL